MPDSTVRLCDEADAILLGACGLPSVRYPDNTEIAPQIELRFHFDLYAGVRPARLIPGVPSPIVGADQRGIDLVLIRESTEGLFASMGKGVVTDTEARETLVITRKTSERLFEFSFRLAERRKARGRANGGLTCVDKANVFRAFAFFREMFDEAAKRHPGRQGRPALCRCLLAMLVKRPWDFDVMVTENMFGDILSDLAAGLIGGMGMAPSADIGDRHAVFQPCHGTAPDIMGQGKANPTAMILSAAMMLDWLADKHGLESAAEAGERIERAVDKAYAGGIKPMEFGGSNGTADITKAVLAALTVIPGRATGSSHRTSIQAQCSAYFPLNCGLRFSMKARAAFAEIFQSMQAMPIFLIASMSRLLSILQHCGDGDLGGLNGQRRVAGNGARDLHRRVPQFGIRQHAIDQADPQRFRGIDPHARVHDQPRPGRPDQRDQMLEAVIAIGDAELGGGNAELAVVGGDADIRQHRDLHAAAEAKAADAGDGRLRIVRQQRALRLAALRIFFRGRRIVAGLFELADIGARDESLVAGADQDHDAHVGIVAQFDQRVAEPLPHLERHGVALFGIVEGDDADAVADALQDLAVGMGFFGVLWGCRASGCPVYFSNRRRTEVRMREGRPRRQSSRPRPDARMIFG